MLRRLDELLGDDSVSRWRIISVSALVIAIYGLTAERFDNSVRQAQIEATLIGGLTFLIQTFVYCLHPTAVRHSISNRIHWGQALKALAASAMVVIAVALSGSRAEATILNSRLQRVLREPGSKEQQAKVFQSVFTFALNAGIELNPELLRQSRSRFADELPSLAWSAVMPAVNYLFNWGLQTVTVQVGTHQPGANLPVCNASNEAFLRSRASSKFGEQWRVEKNPEFTHAILRCRMILDGMSLKDVEVADGIVEYSGGPISLQHVMFNNVTFSMEDTPNARKFAQALLRSDNGRMTLSLE